LLFRPAALLNEATIHALPLRSLSAVFNGLSEFALSGVCVAKESFLRVEFLELDRTSN